MKSAKGIETLFPIIIGLATVSCGPADKQASRENLSTVHSVGRTGTRKVCLSEERITAIADAVADERGWFRRANLRYDEGNVLWKRCSEGMHVPELEGRDYQVVFYGRPGTAFDGDLVVVVDRHSGEVLKVIEWP